MSNEKKMQLAKLRLARVIKKIFHQNKKLTPSALLNSTVQTQRLGRRLLLGCAGGMLILAGLALMVRVDWTLLISILLAPLGLLLLRDAWVGEKRKVRDHLRDLVKTMEDSKTADMAVDIALSDEEINRAVDKVFSTFKAQHRAQESGGIETSGEWDNSVTAEDLDIPNFTDLSLEISAGDLPDLASGAGDIASAILEGIFSSL